MRQAADESQQRADRFEHELEESRTLVKSTQEQLRTFRLSHDHLEKEVEMQCGVAEALRADLAQKKRSNSPI